ncbi:MAG TPA: hypothetical protein VMM76_28545 [Pirellulaceae bacterium]|nr:hypothetical protein [Pirellulaceae bacterium]
MQAPSESKQTEPPGLGYRAAFTVTLRTAASVLSLTRTAIGKKELAEPGGACPDRLAPHEHYDRLGAQPGSPLLVAGVRNVLSNLRCVAFSHEMSTRHIESHRRIAAVTEEHGYPGRPYHAIICKGGEISIEEFMPDGSLFEVQERLDSVDWMVSGTPVWWDCNEHELFDRMITDAADHSHVWQLPRGNHVDATDLTRKQWTQLQDEFIDTLADDRNTAAERLRVLVDGFDLKRENDYLHSVWGVTDDRRLIIIVANGRLEDVGRQAAALGCRRAICVENSGSSALYFVRAPERRPWFPLVSAPNFRPAGTAFIFFGLSDGAFHVMPQPSA